MSSAPRLYPDSGFTFRIVRLLEMSFCAVWDNLENNFRGMIQRLRDRPRETEPDSVRP